MVPSSDIVDNPASLRHFSLTYDAPPSPLYSTHVAHCFEPQREPQKEPKPAPDFEEFLSENREFQKLRASRRLRKQSA